MVGFISHGFINMTSLGRSLLQNGKLVIRPTTSFRQTSQTAEQEAQTDEFRVLNLRPKKNVQTARRARKTVTLPPRSEKMPIDQHWPSVWPGPRTFHPAAVPLPLHQGYPHKKNASPGKYANAELMKIPNFLHLTPPAIKQQCEAIKKFCTEWPKGLETDEQQEEHFPINIITSTYCHSSPSIRDPLSRVVTLKLPLKSLTLDPHAKDKLMRLVGERYDSATGIITLTADRCPTKKQNLDYVYYLLTALFHESWKIEPWESEKQLADMEVFVWQGSVSEANMKHLMDLHEKSPSESKKLANEEEREKFKNAVESIFNDGEDSYTITQYKQAAKKIVSLQS